MLKKLLALLLIIGVALGTAPPAQAAGDIVVKSSAVESGFPTSLTFKIAAASGAPITEIRLHYTTVQLSFAEVYGEAFLIFTPAVSVSAQWTWDLRRSGGMPPGTTVVYWWTLVDNTGARLQTAKEQFKFEDTRFKWQTLKQDKTTIYWYSGATSFAQDIMNTTQQALARLAADTGASLRSEVRIYLYANSNDLLGSMLFPQEWTGGVAFTEYGTIAIGLSTANLAWGRTAIAHELTHMVTHQMVYNPYGGLPTWLEEGLAMHNQGSVDQTFTAALQTAIKNGTLLSLKTLSSPFSSYADISYLSYAESWSAVEYLIDNYGAAKMAELLETFRQGSTYDAALLKVYGKDTKGLNTEWQKSLQPSTSGAVIGDAIALTMK